MNKKLLLAAVLLAPITSYGSDCRYTKDLDFAEDAATLEGLQMDVGAGKLRVTGSPASNQVQVIARACASSRSRLEGLELSHRVRNSDLLIHTEQYHRGSIFSWLSFSNNYSYIDIEITMPSDLALEVDDGSGAVEISNVSSVSLDDGSGSTLIEDIQGDVDIDDGSGSITVFGVAGVISINDGSGPIRIRDSNEVVIEDDGSGEISIENLSGSVNVRNDGSGGIHIRDVTGNVELGHTGSGSVDVSGVAGSYTNHDD